MPDKPTITSLTVTEGFGQNFLRCEFDDPNAEGGLLALRLEANEFWTATTNDRALASKATEGLNEAVHVLPSGASGYYWTKPRLHGRDASGNPTYGDWFPAGATAGVAADQTASIGFSGYLRFPSGVLLQWGSTDSNASGDATVTFPTDWNAGQMFQWVGTVAGGTNIDDVYSVKHHTLTLIGSVMTLGVKVKKVVMSGGVAVIQNAASVPIHWIAVGL